MNKNEKRKTKINNLLLFEQLRNDEVFQFLNCFIIYDDENMLCDCFDGMDLAPFGHIYKNVVHTFRSMLFLLLV